MLNKKESDIFLRFRSGTSSSEESKKKEKSLRSQIVTSNRGGRRYEPYVFTEQGVAMLSSVLNSNRAIQVNIQIMRTFTKLRRTLSTHRDLQEKIEKMERKYDSNFKIVFKVLAKFMKIDPKGGETEVIGFANRGK